MSLIILVKGYITFFKILIDFKKNFNKIYCNTKLWIITKMETSVFI